MQTYVVISSRLPPSPTVRLLSQGFRALSGSGSGISSLHDASSTRHVSGEDKDHESSRLQRTPRRQCEKCS